MKDIPALLEKNLEIMSKYQPKLAQRLRQELDSMDELPAVDIQETDSGRWVKVGESAPFFDKGPVLPARQKSKENAYCFIVQGIGYPPFLFHTLRGMLKDTLSIIVIEPDVHLLLVTFSMTSIYFAAPQAARISFIVYPETSLIDEALWHNVTPIGIFPILEAKTIIHEGLLEASSEPRKVLQKEFWEQIRFRAEQLGNSAEDTLLGVRHGALNTPWIVKGPSITDIRQLFGKHPAVCVASGPSLKKNVEQLKGMEEKCLIVACDTSLLPLLRRGIRPHAVVTIERNLMYDVWIPAILEEFYEECRHILLVSQSVSEPQTAGRWPGPVFVVGKMDSPADAWLVHEVLGMNLMASGMCVAHMAMNFALMMESPVVALIGQDLAFAEDGETTHIEDASSATPDGIAREMAFVKREVPGALGGTVKTHQMWFYFLQIFERFLEGVESGRVFQCSEGGAAIAGTEAIPLARFFEKYVEIDSAPSPLPDPQELSHTEGKYAEYLDFLRTRLDHAAEGLSFCFDLLAAMEKEVDLATAPALLPERRRVHAVKVADLLDRLHASHRALAFIGQSYTHLAGSSMAKNRFLDTVERVQEWKSVHSEIIESHRVNIAFLREWLSYMDTLCRSLHRLGQYASFREEEALIEIEKLLVPVLSASKTELLSEDAVLLAHLLCKVDLLRQKGIAPPTLWNVALFLQLQGRPFEARNLMQHAYSLLEGNELDSNTIALFFLDWARMEASHDLIRMPRFDLALTLLQNIPEHAPQMAELVEQEENKLLQMQRSLINQARHSLKWSDEMKVLDCRNHAQESLAAQNLPEAFSWVMKMGDYLASSPDLVLPQMQWLAKTALDCRGADDTEVNNACEAALAFLFDRQESLSLFGFPWPSKWAAYLQEKGYCVNIV